MPSSQGEPLRPRLARAKNTLKSALADACEADIDAADADELTRIEKTLAIANAAAKEAAAVRRRLSSKKAETTSSAPELPVHRQIEDQQRVSWDVFAVRPAVGSGRSTVRELFREGWLTFDSGVETRRAAPIPAGWESLPADELLRLCAAAETAPRRVQWRNKTDKTADQARDG